MKNKQNQLIYKKKYFSQEETIITHEIKQNIKIYIESYLLSIIKNRTMAINIKLQIIYNIIIKIFENYNQLTNKNSIMGKYHNDSYSILNKNFFYNMLLNYNKNFHNHKLIIPNFNYNQFNYDKSTEILLDMNIIKNKVYQNIKKISLYNNFNFFDIVSNKIVQYRKINVNELIITNLPKISLTKDIYSNLNKKIYNVQINNLFK